MWERGSKEATPVPVAVCLAHAIPCGRCGLPFGPAAEALVSGAFSPFMESSFWVLALDSYETPLLMLGIVIHRKILSLWIVIRMMGLWEVF